MMPRFLVAPAAPMDHQRPRNLRITLNHRLTEHTALAASATLGALRGDTAQFRAAATALDANSNSRTSSPTPRSSLPS